MIVVITNTQLNELCQKEMDTVDKLVDYDQIMIAKGRMQMIKEIIENYNVDK